MQSIAPEFKDAPSQTLRAVLGLRGLIVDGVLKAGDKVAEPLLSDRFGVSRTPARAALAQLREEGLLDALPSGRYVVSTFTDNDLFDAIELRGTLEGLAARFAAERGIASSIAAEMQECVSDMNAAVVEFSQSFDCEMYVRLNNRFHSLLVEAGQSPMVRRSLDRVLSLPFAAPNAFVQSSRSELPEAITIMTAAQEQHRSLLEAICNREGKRAEAIAWEHARCAWRYLRMALSEGQLKFPGSGLIRRSTVRPS